MLKNISIKLYQGSNGKVTLIAIFIFVFFLAFILPSQAEIAQSNSRGAGTPDTSFLYSTTNLYAMAEAYGPDGRSAYVRSRFTFDLIFPLAYLFFLATSLSWVLSRVVPNTNNRWRLLNLFPIFGALFDYLENIFASIVMINYPAQSPVVDILTPICTLIKWFFVNGSFVILIPALIIAVWNGIVGKKN